MPSLRPVLLLRTPVQGEIIIIGAGPAGLMAATELAKKGRKVLILEARDRIGGRAYTLDGAEMGAEFIHGDLPIIQSLLQEAGISYTATAGEWIQLRAGKSDAAFEATGWSDLMTKLGSLKDDMSLQEFLTEHFADDTYAALKDQAISYAEGYDTADTSRVSAKALYEEWSADDEEQYRIEGGYGALMAYLEKTFLGAGGRILCGHAVSNIEVRKDGVRIVANSKEFYAPSAIVALPLGVLQDKEGIHMSGIDVELFQQAIQSLGFGDVIKYVLRFSEPFWEATYPGLGFLLTAAPVPTWWTQLPQRNNMLTGWLSGRAAHAHAAMTEAQLLDVALSSLAQIFGIEKQTLIAMLKQHHVANWSSDPYTRGSYAYATVGFEAAQKLLSQPLGGQLSFAGEYLYNGPAMGTVEAALWSGREVAQLVLRFAG